MSALRRSSDVGELHVQVRRDRLRDVVRVVLRDVHAGRGHPVDGRPDAGPAGELEPEVEVGRAALLNRRSVRGSPARKTGREQRDGTQEDEDDERRDPPVLADDAHRATPSNLYQRSRVTFIM